MAVIRKPQQFKGIKKRKRREKLTINSDKHLKEILNVGKLKKSYQLISGKQPVEFPSLFGAD